MFGFEGNWETRIGNLNNFKLSFFSKNAVLFLIIVEIVYNNKGKCKQVSVNFVVKRFSKWKGFTRRM